MKTYKIVEKKNLWFVLSITIIIIGLFSVINNGLNNKPLFNYGIDFVGGTNMLLKFDSLDKSIQENPTDAEIIKINTISKIRGVLENLNLKQNAIQITENNEVIIKTLELEHEKGNSLRKQLSETIGKYDILEIDFIGPTIGKELRNKSMIITILVSLFMLIYVTWRFQLGFGIAAIIALLHDALIMLSIAALLKIEINTIYIAAFLTVLGYSINDTIVLFDRIRENINLRTYENPITLNNVAISQTLKRTIMTSLTTLMVVMSLYIFGGLTIKEFSLVLLIGIVAGTYSSIFIASPVLTIISKDELIN